jgi:hypothetical protein
MTSFDLRTLRLRSGDQAREPVEIDLEPLVLGGQTYAPRPNPAPAELTVTRASSGTVLELALDVTLAGPDDVHVRFTVPDFLSRGDELGEVARIVIRAWERMDRASGLGA